MSAPARILHFRNCRGISTITGPERYLLNLASAVDRAAFEIRLLCAFNPLGPRPIFRDLLRDGSAFSPAQLRLLDMPTAYSAADLRALRDLLKRDDIRLLQTHDARSDFIGLPVARGLRRPSVAFAHGWVNWDRTLSKQRLYAALEALSIRLADRIIVHSRVVEQDLRRRGIPERKLRYIPLGVDTRGFAPSGERGDLRRELGIPASSPIIGTVGRLQPWKGHRYFLQAAAAVSRVLPEARFVLVGDVTLAADEAYRDEIHRTAGELGLGDRCHFLGTRTDVPAILRSFDVFLLSSIRDPIPWVLLEAQACGTPVVSSAVDGTPEAVQDGKTGILVPSRDSGAMAAAILRLLADRELRLAMAKAGPAWIEERYSVQAMVRGTEAVYRELLG